MTLSTHATCTHMCTITYTHVHTRTHAHTHITHTHTHAHTHTNKHPTTTSTHTHTSKHPQAHMHTSSHRGNPERISAALAAIGVETEKQDPDLRSEMAYGMFDTRGKVRATVCVTVLCQSEMRFGLWHV